MTRVLLTGASGFIGSHLLARLPDCRLRLGLRSMADTGLASMQHEITAYDTGTSGQDYGKLLDGIDVVVHLAGAAHIRHPDPDHHDRVNAQGTARLVKEAVTRGISRFVFLSTIKVHGESTAADDAITENSPIAAGDSYSESKYRAERAIQDACEGSLTRYVILRPPLVYGPGVRANFLNLLRLVSSRLPLPFSTINNRRSFIYVENLADLIRVAISHPAAADRIFVLKDHDDSTPGLITALAGAFGYRPLLFPVPDDILAAVARIIGQQQTLTRLTESLLVDDSLLRQQLDWQPSIDYRTAISRTVTWFRTRN